jgi:hypothetical protein
MIWQSIIHSLPQTMQYVTRNALTMTVTTLVYYYAIAICALTVVVATTTTNNDVSMIGLAMGINNMTVEGLMYCGAGMVRKWNLLAAWSVWVLWCVSKTMYNDALRLCFPLTNVRIGKITRNTNIRKHTYLFNGNDHDGLNRYVIGDAIHDDWITSMSSVYVITCTCRSKPFAFAYSHTGIRRDAYRLMGDMHIALIRAANQPAKNPHYLITDGREISDISSTIGMYVAGLKIPTEMMVDANGIFVVPDGHDRIVNDNKHSIN